VAIIDTLQTYNWRKLFETRYKGIFENVDALSCVDPNKYRYQMQDIIAYDTYNVHISVLGIVLFPSFDITLMQSRFEGSVVQEGDDRTVTRVLSQYSWQICLP